MISGKKANAANNTFGGAKAALNESTNGGKGKEGVVTTLLHNFRVWRGWC